MAGDEAAKPDGTERMKRIPPKDFALQPKRYEYDPKRAYQKKQLAEIGAISIAWNQIEGQIDHLGSHILLRYSPFYVVITAGEVISFSGKIRLLRACADHAEILDAAAKRCIDIALMGVLEYRSYRNAIIHHHVYDHKKGIGSFIAENGKPYQIMVTNEALTGFYTRLDLLKHEVMNLAQLFLMELSRPGEIIVGGRDRPAPDQPKALREVAVPQATKEVVRYQQARLSLPPLPLFPDARRVRPKKAAAKSRRRLSGKDRSK